MSNMAQDVRRAFEEDGFGGVLGLFSKAKDREELRKAAKARAKRYGISIKDNGHLTPPKGYPEKPSEYGDPVNYKYPCDAEHAQAAVNYYNQSGQRKKGGYTGPEWAIVGRRIARLVNRHLDTKWKYKGGELVKKDEED